MKRQKHLPRTERSVSVTEGNSCEREVLLPRVLPVAATSWPHVSIHDNISEQSKLLTLRGRIRIRNRPCMFADVGVSCASSHTLTKEPNTCEEPRNGRGARIYIVKLEDSERGKGSEGGLGPYSSCAYLTTRL
ncbi:unnamed protein product [Leuciscus chuanchicus]